MSYIDSIVEKQIAAAIERGELDPGPLKGKPIPDIDRRREAGWWAEQFVRRERSTLAREEALDERRAWERRFRAAGDLAELGRLVHEANEWVDGVNERLLPEHALDHLTAHEHERRLRPR